MSLEVTKPPTMEVLEKVRSEFGLNEQRIKEAIEHIRDWLELQPHLPKEIDDGRLERWLIRCKNSTEKVKQTLDMYYTLRTNVPDVMTGWDTNAEWFKNTTSILSVFPVPQLTPDCDRVVIYRLTTSDATLYETLNAIKIAQMVTEIKISEDYCRSDIYIIDFSFFSLGHVKKISFPLLKKYELCSISGYNLSLSLSLQSGYNSRIKAIHILNAPPYAHTAISMFRAVLKSKLTKRIHVYGNDLTSFYEQVPKEVLPNEYGGTSGSIEEIWDRWKKKLQSYQGIFLEREQHKSDESKRPGRFISNSELLGFEGSFRKLNVD